MLQKKKVKILDKETLLSKMQYEFYRKLIFFLLRRTLYSVIVIDMLSLKKLRHWVQYVRTYIGSFWKLCP